MNIDTVYICYCGRREDVVLDCGHSFCMGCTAKLIQRNKYKKSEAVRNIKDFRSMEIECPKCLAFTKISNV